MLDFLMPGFMHDRVCKDFSDAVAWNEDKTKFADRLKLKASSYLPHRLFAVKPTENKRTILAHPMVAGRCALSPNKQFRYTEIILPKGMWLDLVQGKRRGKVCFDGDVVIPRLNEWAATARDFKMEPWMSLSPMETLSQRYGVIRAKGDVVVAGLGMGWLLRKVAQKKTVKKVTLVERSQELIDWILPQLKITKPLKVVCDDARRVVPTMTADVAVVDIDMSYGGNYFPDCPHIGYVWVWGANYCC